MRLRTIRHQLMHVIDYKQESSELGRACPSVILAGLALHAILQQILQQIAA